MISLEKGFIYTVVIHQLLTGRGSRAISDSLTVCRHCTCLFNYNQNSLSYTDGNSGGSCRSLYSDETSWLLLSLARIFRLFLVSSLVHGEST